MPDDELLDYVTRKVTGYNTWTILRGKQPALAIEVYKMAIDVLRNKALIVLAKGEVK